MERVSQDVLNQLFTAVCDELADQIKNGKEVVDKEGNKHRASPDAAILNVARQLLKDNGIEADPTAQDGPLDRVKKVVPFPTKEATHSGS